MSPITWFKVDDGLAFHVKALRAGNAALGLWVRAGAWCSQHLTDGEIPTDIALTLGEQEEVDRLVKVGLWEKVDDETYRFHDWFDSNPSRAEVEAARKRERDKKANARAKRASDQLLFEDDPVDDFGDTHEEDPDPVPPDIPPHVPPGVPGGQPSGGSEGIPGGVRSTRPVPTRPDPSTTSSPTAGSRESPPRKRPTGPARRKPSSPIPRDFTITEEMRAWHRGKGVTDQDAAHQTERMIRWALANDKRYVEWKQVWRNWIDGALDRGHIRAQTRLRAVGGTATAGPGIKPWM